MRHLLTPFGNDISLDLFYQTPTNNFFGSLHIYNNLNRLFFGLEGTLIDKSYFDKKLLLTIRAQAWVQPKYQSFTISEGTLEGLLGVRSTYKFGIIHPYIEIEGKTKGWIMGNVFLEDKVSLIMGLNISMK